MIPLGALRAFYVVSRPYDVYPQTEVDPAEPGCDVVLVCARTKHRAKILAVRSWRRGRVHDAYAKRNHLAYYEGEHPFKGLEVIEASRRMLDTEQSRPA